MDTFKRYLNEMGYVSDPEYDPPMLFDFEIELFNPKNNPNAFAEFVKKIKDILSGKEMQDKYGNKMQLTSGEQKLHYLELLSNDSIFLDTISAYFGKNLGLRFRDDVKKKKEEFLKFSKSV